MTSWLKQTKTFKLVQDVKNEELFYAEELSAIGGLVIPLKFDSETYQLSVLCGTISWAYCVEGVVSIYRGDQ